MQRASFQLGVDAAVVLKAGSVDQSVVKGLNSLGLPELMRNKIKVTEFRTDFDVSFTGAGEFGDITFSGNLVLGDTKGQDQLKEYLIDNEKFQDCRVYLDLLHFMAVDLARDPGASFQVQRFSPGKADKNGVFPFEGAMVVGGRFAYFTTHLTAATIAFVAAGNTITDSAAGFAAAGFVAGQTLIVEGSGGNDGQYLVTAVAAGELTLSATVKAVVDEVAGEAVTLHGGKL